MTEQVVTQAIGRLRGEIRRYLRKELSVEGLAQTFRGAGLEMPLTAPGSYPFRIPYPAAVVSPPLEEAIDALPRLYAVAPAERAAEQLILRGDDVECLPGILTELTGFGLLRDFH